MTDCEFKRQIRESVRLIVDRFQCGHTMHEIASEADLSVELVEIILRQVLRGQK